MGAPAAALDEWLLLFPSTAGGCSASGSLPAAPVVEGNGVLAVLLLEPASAPVEVAAGVAVSLARVFVSTMGVPDGPVVDNAVVGGVVEGVDGVDVVDVVDVVVPRTRNNAETLD